MVPPAWVGHPYTMMETLERSLLQIHLENPERPRFEARFLFCPCGCPIPVALTPGREPEEHPFCPRCGIRLSKVDLTQLDPYEDRF